MPLTLTEVDTEEFTVTARCYYTEEKVAVTFSDDKRRKQFFWGDSEQYDGELEAIKAAYAFIDGITH